MKMNQEESFRTTPYSYPRSLLDEFISVEDEPCTADGKVKSNSRETKKVRIVLPPGCTLADNQLKECGTKTDQQGSAAMKHFREDSQAQSEADQRSKGYLDIMNPHINSCVKKTIYVENEPNAKEKEESFLRLKKLRIGDSPRFMPSIIKRKTGPKNDPLDLGQCSAPKHPQGGNGSQKHCRGENEEKKGADNQKKICKTKSNVNPSTAKCIYVEDEPSDEEIGRSNLKHEKVRMGDSRGFIPSIIRRRNTPDNDRQVQCCAPQHPRDENEVKKEEPDNQENICKTKSNINPSTAKFIHVEDEPSFEENYRSNLEHEEVILGGPRVFMPSITRRKNTPDIDQQIQCSAPKHSPIRYEVKNDDQESNIAKKQCHDENYVKDSSRKTFEADKHKEKVCLSEPRTNPNVDEFVYVESVTDNGEKKSIIKLKKVGMHELPSTVRKENKLRGDQLERRGDQNKGGDVIKILGREESKTDTAKYSHRGDGRANEFRQNIIEAVGQSHQETIITIPNSYPCLDSVIFVDVTDLNKVEISANAPPYPLPLETDIFEQIKPCEVPRPFLKESQDTLLRVRATAAHTLPHPDQSPLEANGDNKGENDGKSKLLVEENEIKKHSVQRNEVNEHSSEVEKHSVDEIGVVEPRLGGNGTNKISRQYVNRHNIKPYERKEHNVGENETVTQRPENNETKNHIVGENEVNDGNLEEVVVLSRGKSGTKKHSLENEGDKHKLDGCTGNEGNLDPVKVKTVYRRCSAVGCESVESPTMRLLMFPSHPCRVKIWAELAGREDLRVGHICNRHFRVQDFTRPDRKKLIRGANPCYYTGPLNPITQDYCPFEGSGGPREAAVYCSAVNCGLSQKTHPEVSFAPFPARGDARYHDWMRVAGAVRFPRYLCGRHFDRTQFSDDRRTYLKSRAIPKYKSGPLNPKTDDYTPIEPDDSENSATALDVSPVIGQDINIAAVLPTDDQNISTWAAHPLVGQQIEISGVSQFAGQKLKIASASSLFGQNVKIAEAGSVLSQNITVIASPSVDDPTIKTATKGSAAEPDHTCSSEKKDSSDDVGNEMDVIYRRCDAIHCPSSYKNDPKVKHFSIPGKASNASAAEKKRRQHWIDVVGGTKDERARHLCQYHFAADTFIDKTRTSLVRRANPLFPYGPLNPVTKDYCPIGEEQRSLSSRDFLRARCCVDGCTTYSFNTTGLFGFPMHDREAYEEWTIRVGVNEYFTEQHIRMKFRICPKHFSSCCTVIDKENKLVYLKFGALPTIDVPCFKGEPNEENSFVQKRTLSADEVEALKMLSESDRVCNLNDICDKENDEQTSLELKRKMSEVKEVPNKKSKNDPIADGSGKQLVLLPVQDENGQQSFVLADFSSHADFASISGQNQKFQTANENERLAALQEPKTEKTPDAVDKVKDNSESLKKRMCTYWSPEDFNDKQKLEKKRKDHQDPLNKSKPLHQTKAKPISKLGYRRVSQDKKSDKEKSAKEMYEDFSLDIQDYDIGNEIDIDVDEPSVQNSDSVKPPAVPTEKTDNTETALIKIFGSCEASDDNVFSCFIDSSKVPEHDEDNNIHSYCSANSLNVIRSAAELCEFNDLKLKQLERMIGTAEETSSELEQILIKHLCSVMCITGVDFLKKCFDQVIKEEIVKKKEKDKTRRYATQKSDTASSSNVKYPEDTRKFAVALQTFSGKAYHAMTQLMDLPAQSITRSWTCHTNGDPGFSDRAFKLLCQEVRRGPKTLTVSLGVEEVPLKQDVCWDGQRPFGLTDLGYGAVDYDYVPEATRALVFFATALNRSWKIPLGYCLGDNLTAPVRANLVIQYLYKLAEAGVKCIALVCNYSLMTYQMLIELDAISEEYYAPLTGSFPHPSAKGDRVHCFVDIHQLMKSINTLWAEKKVFAFKSKDEIEWSHMTLMNDFIQSDNKFPNPGLENVYNDLLSLKSLIKRDPRSSYKYNALVLALLKNLGLKGFENVTGTAVFLDKLNSLTEMFSSCHSFDNGERQPLSKGNLNDVTQKLTNFIAYFNNLTYSDGSKIMTSKRKLPLVLLFSNITSLKTMVRKVFTADKYKLNNIKTESLNLDCIHQTLLEITEGKDGLLTPLEFKNAFVKYVENLSLEPSSRLANQKSEESKPLLVEDALGFTNSFAYQFSPVPTVCESVHEFFTENVIEHWLQVAHCTDCSQLIQKELLKCGNHDSKGNIIEDIHRMLRTAETILAELDEIPMDAFRSWFDKLANKTLNSLTSLKGFKNNSHLFNSKPFGEVTHFTVMVKDMLRIFLRLRLCFLTRQEKIRIKPPRQFSLRYCLGRSWA